MGEAKTSPRRVNVALRRAQALKMRAAGATYPEIVAAGLGYKTKSAAVQDVQRALAETVGEPAAELRVLEAVRLDHQLQRVAEAEKRVHEVLARQHVTVSNGKVICLPNDQGVDEPLVDDAPILQAVAQLKGLEELRLRIAERRAKLLGLDAPAKVAMLTDDDLDRAEQQLRAELAELDSAAASEDRDDPEAES